jgi:hypothetical protein
MGKQITGKKRAFAQFYAQHGDAPKAAEQAGYSSTGTIYRYLKKDASGQYTDPVFRTLMAEFGAEGVEPLPEPVQLPARIERKKNLAAEVVKLEVVPRGGDISISRVRELLLHLAEDENTPAGPRVQALNILLKDLRDEQVPDVPDDDDILSAIQEKLSVSNG